MPELPNDLPPPPRPATVAGETPPASLVTGGESRALLRLSAITKAFGGVVAVRDINFDVAEGELLGLIGPNGAGKSTVLNMIAGVYHPTAGQIWFRGKRIDRLPAHRIARQGIARANQIPRPFGRLSVADNVRVAAQSIGAGSGRKRRDVREILELCGLQSQADKLAGSLTLLNLKRLEVARALALSPELLLLDEVAAGLVGQEIDDIVGLITGVHEHDVTILVVEHVQAVIRRLASRVIVLDWGKQIAEGTPAEIAANPEVVRTYLGTGEAAAASASEAKERQTSGGELLRVEGLAVDYGKLRAVQDVDLLMRPGQVVALLGANGAGKSSIARAIVGLIPSAAGRVWLDGEDISKLPAHQRARRGLAICHEGRRLFTELSVRDNLRLAARYSRSKTSFGDRLDIVTTLFPILGERINQRTGTLSGGQQQMVAIARAMVADPRVLILDELSLGLAPALVDEIYETLPNIQKLGVGILLVEQNVFRSLAIADQVYVVERGRISLSGSAGEVRADDRLQRAYFGGGVKAVQP
jgi:branched-chain amino acid transport system ATP-binding protein